MCPESVPLPRGLAALRTTALSSVLVVFVAAQSAWAQTTELSGVVQDSSHASLPNAAITATSEDTGVKWTTTSNHEGYYNLPFLKAESYAITVEAAGFRSVAKRGVNLEAGQRRRVDFVLEPVPFTEAVTVAGGTPSVRSESAGVSTTISRQFVENLPLNGRTFQPLLALIPGITPTNSDGQFSTNGQRDNANYFTVDGVGANVGLSSFRNLGETGSGSIPAFNVLGGTQNLATLDALQEITVQTSAYSAEFGRTAGAQVQVVTRSGTNRFRGTAFDYFRDDALDANDWFANLKGVPKPAYRQNDAGGVVGGPIVRNRTFFLLSYEGLRLTQPQFTVVDVPSRNARQLAPASIRPLLDAFPLPNGPENAVSMLGQFAAAYSNAGAADTTSVRLDHVVRAGFTLFGRYSDGRSELNSRADSLTHVISDQVNTRSLTGGGTLVLTPTIVSEFRANYSTNQSTHANTADDFGGATPPPDTILFPTPFASPNSSRFIFSIGAPGGPRFVVGRSSDHRVHQVNLVDKISVIKGSNAFRFGVDFLHQSLAFGPQDYGLGMNLSSVPDAVSGSTPSVLITTFDPIVLAFMNVSAFALDQWRPNRRLTLDIGVRWELSPAPHTTDSQELYTLRGFGNPSSLRLAPAGTPLYSTTYANFAPRLGLSYQLSDSSGRARVLRGGFGVFYGLGRGVIAQATESFPHSRRKTAGGQPLPLGPEVVAPPTLSSLDPPYSGQSFLAFGPDHVLPRTYEWNVTLDQMIGAQRTLSVSYVGSAGRELLRRVQMIGPPPNFVGGSTIDVTTNSAASDYRAIQLTFQSRFSHGLQAMASYTLAHSTDNGSSDVILQSTGSGVDPDKDRGPSDFDVRHTVQGALTYTIPAARFNGVAAALLQDWSIDSTLLVRTATPVNVTIMRQLGVGVDFVTARPDPVPSEPRYIEDPTVAGGLRINPAAFVVPTESRQGQLGRNALRGFGLSQVDFGVRRTLHLARGSTVQVKAEFFNLFNHPNFANPDGFLGRSVPPLVQNGTFGVSTTMAAKAPITGVTTGLSSLYRAGGSRSVQLSLRVAF